MTGKKSALKSAIDRAVENMKSECEADAEFMLIATDKDGEFFIESNLPEDEQVQFLEAAVDEIEDDAPLDDEIVGPHSDEE